MLDTDLAQLGTVEGLGEVKIEQLILGLRRAKGEDVSASVAAPTLGTVEDFGHVHAVGSVWDRLGLSEALVKAGINGEAAFSPAELIRMLVVNRICEPGSKLALLDWLDSVHYGEGEKPSYHQSAWRMSAEASTHPPWQIAATTSSLYLIFLP